MKTINKIDIYIFFIKKTNKRGKDENKIFDSYYSYYSKPLNI